MISVKRRSALTSPETESILKIAEQCKLSKWSYTDYFIEAERENSIFLIARSSRQIIGFLCARVVQGEADLLNFGVLENHRRTGVGNLLFEALMEILSGCGKGELWLEVRESNSDAVRFYTRRGFSLVQNRKNFYTDPVENALVLKLVF